MLAATLCSLFLLGVSVAPGIGLTQSAEQPPVTLVPVPAGGPLTHTRVLGQRFEALLKVPEDGEYTLLMKTQSGRASLWVDVNLDGVFAAEEKLIENTPTSGERIAANSPLKLQAGRSYLLRVDHATALPRPVLIVEVEGPGIEGSNGSSRAEVSPYLELPEKR